MLAVKHVSRSLKFMDSTSMNGLMHELKPNIYKTWIKASDKCKNEIANLYIFNSHLICMKLNRSLAIKFSLIFLEKRLMHCNFQNSKHPSM